MSRGTFVTAINCMDGRVQLPVIEYLKDKYGVDYVDMVTEPGPIKILAENSNTNLVESIKARVKISVEKHGSAVVAIVGHYDCAGNPVDKAAQLTQLAASVKLVESWKLGVEVITLWVDESWTTSQV